MGGGGEGGVPAHLRKLGNNLCIPRDKADIRRRAKKIKAFLAGSCMPNCTQHIHLEPDNSVCCVAVEKFQEAIA